MASTNISQTGATTAVKVYVSVNEVSSNGNYRTLYLCLVARPEDGYGNIERDGRWELNIPGVYSGSGSGIITDSGLYLFESDAVEVYVEPGTTYADVNISFSATLVSPTAGSRTVTGTITRITGLSLVADSAISSAKDIYFGDRCQIVWTPSSDAFYYKLQFSMGDYSYTSGVIAPRSTNEYSYTDLTIPLSVAENITDSTYGTMAVSLSQYSDYACKNPVGVTATRSFKVTLKDDVVPSITSCYVEIDNSDNAVLSSWNIPLSGYTKVRIVAAGSGVYGSSIKSFTITGDYKATVNSNRLDYTGKAITKSGNRSFIITCTDTRGRVSEEVVTDNIYFLPYVSPKISKFSVVKEDYGDSNIRNDRMVATASWTYDDVNGYNNSYGKVYYKISTAEDWTPHSGYVTNGLPFTMTDFIPNEELSYNFKIVVTDTIGISVQKDAFSSTVQVLMDFQAGGKGLGIGKICEIDNIGNGTQSMEVSMDSYFFGDVFIKDKNQTLEEYIRKISKYLVAGEDYGDDDPVNVIDKPVVGQVYYKRIQES